MVRRSGGEIANVIAYSRLLFAGELDEILPKTPASLLIQPAQPLDNLFPVPLLLWVGSTDPFINEIHNSQAAGAWRFLVSRQNKIAENGNAVPVTVTVDSPMTDKDYVEAIHVVADGNPNPGVASFTLTPLAGKAEVQLRVRMASTQKVIALAEMSDGSLWTLAREVKVTIGGCGG